MSGGCGRPVAPHSKGTRLPATMAVDTRESEACWERRIASKEARVAVVGMGYVGLPLALAFAEEGFRVTALDVDAEKIAALQRSESYIRHLTSERIASVVSASRLVPRADYDALQEVDAILICVPTPLGPHQEPDLRYVRRTTEEIAGQLRPGQLVVLESTTYPGTTEEVLAPILSSGGLRCGADFFLAYSPEREDPGSPERDTRNVPKLVGGVDPVSGRIARALYARVFREVVPVASARVAEAAKLTENVFRAVNIALVNELKMVFGAMGVDIWEVLDAAATKPFGFMRFDPGPGWGGHCIPVDPFYLAWKAREHGARSAFVERAGEVNVGMPQWVVQQVMLALNERGQAMRGARVLVLGVAYKPNVDDARESPAFPILERLIALGARVSYHDPWIPELPRVRAHPGLPCLRSVPLSRAVLSEADVVLIVTDHDAVDYEAVAAHARLVVDTRGRLRGRPHVVLA